MFPYDSEQGKISYVKVIKLTLDNNHRIQITELQIIIIIIIIIVYLDACSLSVYLANLKSVQVKLHGC